MRQQEIDPGLKDRLERWTANELSPDEVKNLMAELNQRGDRKTLEELYRPFDTDERERITRAIHAKILRDRRTKRIRRGLAVLGLIACALLIVLILRAR